jgi:hypothetical protein
MHSVALTPEQFAERYAISTRSVIRMLESGTLGGIDVGCGSKNRRWRIRKCDIAEFEQRRANTAAMKTGRQRRVATKDDPNYTRFFAEV